MKLIRSLTLAILLALSLATIPAAAANRAQIELTVNEALKGGVSTFSISGIPVSEGVICSGGVIDSIIVTGVAKGSLEVSDRRMNFVCSDGSGSFVLEFSRVNARWNIVSGDGAYTTLTGKGSWKTITYSPSGCTCTVTYQGSVKNGK